jgi:hypothetical protein
MLMPRNLNEVVQRDVISKEVFLGRDDDKYVLKSLKSPFPFYKTPPWSETYGGISKFSSFKN